MNICIEISYLGSDFFGSQIQPKLRTVQGELEKVLFRVLREKVKVEFCGRTDAGVHARRAFCNFKVEKLFCEAEKLAFIANKKLPSDIFIVRSFEVGEDFHARYLAKQKTYRYVFYNGDYDVFSAFSKMHTSFPLDFEKMQSACADVVGKHDFFAFMATGSNKINTTRTVSHCSVTREPCKYIGDGEGGVFDLSNAENGRNRGFLYTLEITADGFLYNMVRIIAGTVIDIGREHLPCDAMKKAIENRDRSYLGKTLPPHGLYMWDVRYENEI